MAQSSRITPREARKKDTPDYYPTIGSLPQALKEDFRAACKAFNNIPENIAEALLVQPGTVYSWFSNRGHVFIDEQIEEIVRITGGAHTIAFLKRLAASGPTQSRGDFEIAKEIGQIVEDVAETNKKVLGYLAPDDGSPLEIDPDERHELRGKLVKLAAEIRTTITHLDAKEGDAE